MTVSSKKTDNHNLPAKLTLRALFLREYHAERAPKVFDCCQGSGVIWKSIRREVEVASYWGVDLKYKAGRLKIDSVRVLDQPGWDFDVIDVDTYGSPWKHWSAICRYVQKPTTVFLTIGNTLFKGSVDSESLLAMGLGVLAGKIPSGIIGKLSDMSIPYCLAGSERVRILRCVEASNHGNARYIGLRVEPVEAKEATRESSLPARPSEVNATT